MRFVVPGPEAPISGGNRYNDTLIAALGAQRIDSSELDHHALDGELWVDSLYLELLPRLRARARRIGLLAHSLPSQLGEASGQHVDAAHERTLLALVDCALAPSATMAKWLRERAPALQVHVVEPAIDALPVASKPGGPLRALMVANLLPNKGVLGFLEQLAPRLSVHDRFSLRLIGRPDLAGDYGQRCTAFAEERIVFAGGMPHSALQAEYARAHVLVSASRSESYGMAIAEARAHGCIVLAHAGGHVDKVIDPLCDVLTATDEALAATLVAWVRDDSLYAWRSMQALQERLRARDASEVAREFLRAREASAARAKP